MSTRAALPDVICCGLATVDQHLHGCDVPLHLEHVTPFSHTTAAAGGSAPQTSLSLSALGVRTTALIPVGEDEHARTLQRLLKDGGVDVVSLSYDDEHSPGGIPTALAILPLFTDGRRGCFVTLGANHEVEPAHFRDHVVQRGLLGGARVLHFGYPHLMHKCRGTLLATDLFESVRAQAPHIALTLDLNGASTADTESNIVTPSLPLVAHVHANADEARIVSGEHDLRAVASWFLARDAASVSVTCGRGGAVLATNSDAAVLRTANLPASIEAGAFVHAGAFAVATGVHVNASGAGDAFVAGVVAAIVEAAAASQREQNETQTCSADDLLDAGLASALRRIDHTLAPGGGGIHDVVALARRRDRMPPDALVD